MTPSHRSLLLGIASGFAVLIAISALLAYRGVMDLNDVVMMTLMGGGSVASAAVLGVTDGHRRACKCRSTTRRESSENIS